MFSVLVTGCFRFLQQHIGKYPFTLLATLLDTNKKLIPCAKHSKLKKELHHEGIQELLETKLTKKELKELETEQKKKIIQKEHGLKQEKNKTLEEHFENVTELVSRNSAIMSALEDGYKQAEISRYLKLTPSAVAKVRKNMG